MIWLARGLWLLAAILAVLSALLGALFPGIYSALGDEDVGGAALYVTLGIVGIGYATAGLLILRQRPRHAVGWLLLVAGPLLTFVFTAFAIGVRLTTEGHGLGVWLVVISSAGFWPALLLAGPALALIFPDGRLPSRHWRWAVGVAVAILGVGLLLTALRPGSLDPENDLPANPIGLELLPGWLSAMVEVAGTAVTLGAVALGVVAIIVRFRRAAQEERQQLKWFVFAIVIWAAFLPVALAGGSIVLAAFSLGLLLLVPAAVVVAITRHRLYEIDTLINRTMCHSSASSPACTPQASSSSNASSSR